MVGVYYELSSYLYLGLIATITVLQMSLLLTPKALKGTNGSDYPL